jgi:hypothetical protein
MEEREKKLAREAQKESLEWSLPGFLYLTV